MKPGQLSDRTIATTKPDVQKTVRLTDGGNMYLLIDPAGSKLWRWDYTFEGRRKTLALGAYPTVKVARAREKVRDARELLDRGIDPVAAKRDKSMNTGADCFRAIAELWLEKEARHLGPGTVAVKRSRLTRYLLPTLGALRITQITPAHLLSALRPIDRAGKSETTHRVREIAGQILRFAMVEHPEVRDCSAAVVAQLAPVKVKHLAAVIEPRAIGELLDAVEHVDDAFPTVRAALRLAPYVALRNSELREAEWIEIDFNNRGADGAPMPVWRIPGARMKMKDDHLVPLSRQAVAILREHRRINGDGRFLFPNFRTTTRPMSDAAITAAIRRLGYTRETMTLHGFRTIFSTRLNELGWDPELIELQLAHKDRNKVRDAYNRSTKLPERARMMQAFADHLDALRAAARPVGRPRLVR